LKIPVFRAPVQVQSPNICERIDTLELPILGSTLSDRIAVLRLRDALRQILGVGPDRLSTEQQYVNWVGRLLRFQPQPLLVQPAAAL
jgi:hypothetical protein